MVQRTPITQKGLDALEPDELAVFEWQYHQCSHFYKALWEAIIRADDGNLLNLAKGFPTEVMGYICFKDHEGWWDKVEKKFMEANEEELQRREENKG